LPYALLLLPGYRCLPHVTLPRCRCVNDAPAATHYILVCSALPLRCHVTLRYCRSDYCCCCVYTVRCSRCSLLLILLPRSLLVLDYRLRLYFYGLPRPTLPFCQRCTFLTVLAPVYHGVTTVHLPFLLMRLRRCLRLRCTPYCCRILLFGRSAYVLRYHVPAVTVCTTVFVATTLTFRTPPSVRSFSATCLTLPDSWLRTLPFVLPALPFYTYVLGCGYPYTFLPRDAHVAFRVYPFHVVRYVAVTCYAFLLDYTTVLTCYPLPIYCLLVAAATFTVYHHRLFVTVRLLHALRLFVRYHHVLYVGYCPLPYDFAHVYVLPRVYRTRRFVTVPTLPLHRVVLRTPRFTYAGLVIHPLPFSPAFVTVCC